MIYYTITDIYCAAIAFYETWSSSDELNKKLKMHSHHQYSTRWFLRIYFSVMVGIFKFTKKSQMIFFPQKFTARHVDMWELYEIFSSFLTFLSRLSQISENKKCREQQINYVDRVPEKLSLNTCDQVCKYKVYIGNFMN